MEIWEKEKRLKKGKPEIFRLAFTLNLFIIP